MTEQSEIIRQEIIKAIMADSNMSHEEAEREESRRFQRAIRKLFSSRN